MVCKKCGAEIENGQNICPECGTQNNEMSKGLKISVIVACFVILAAVIGVVIWITMGNEEAASNTPTVAPPAATVETTEGTTEETEEVTEPAQENTADSYTVTDDLLVENRDVIVAEIGNYQLTVAQLQLHYWFQVAQYYSSNLQYIAYGQIALDPKQPLDKQPCTENPAISWQEFFAQKGVSAWRGYALMNQMADEAGYELPEDTMEDMKAEFLLDAQAAGFETVDEFVLDMLHKTVCTSSTVEDYWEYMELINRANAYYMHWYESSTPTDEELESYYLKNEETFKNGQVDKDAGNVVNVRHILFMVENGDWAAAEKKANEALLKWKNGGATEELFAQLANELSEDDGSNTTGGLYSQVVPGQMVEVFDSWIMDDARKYGDTAVLKADYHYQGYHVMFFVSGKPIWKEVAAQEIMAERSTDMAAEAKDKWEFKQFEENIMLGTPAFE